MKKQIRFRPHHFLCTVGFEGKGYSPEFVDGYQKIADLLRTGDSGNSIEIEVVEKTDSICEPCPNRRGVHCETEEKISKLDQAHARVLEIQPGDRLTWGEAKTRIREKVQPEDLSTICAPCSWRPLGICERALEKLRSAPLLMAVVFLSMCLPSGVRAQEESATPTPAPTPRASEERQSSPEVTPSVLPLPASQPSPAGKLPWPTTDKSELVIWKKSLPKKAPKGARDLALALKALNDKKYSRARSLARALRGNSIYADHALSIEGQAALFEARDQLAKSPGTANTLGTQAIQAYEKILSEQLISPWHPRAAERLAQAELIRGVALASLKKKSESIKFLERGFQRLLLERAHHLMSIESLDTYAKLCKAKPTDLCESWVLRLANLFSKNSKESRTLAEHFKKIVDQAKPNFANSKITIGYKQKDSDEVAFDEAYAHVIEKKWGTAKSAFRKFLDEFPRSTHRHRARYWLARSIEADDDLKDAKSTYETVTQESPLTVYGMLSQWKLELDPLSRYSSVSPPLQESDVFQSPQEVLRMGRVRDLIAAGANELAAMDLQDVRPRDTASGAYLLQLAGLSTLSGTYLTSFRFLTELIQRQDEIVYSEETLDLVFPVVEEKLIRKTGGTLDLDPVLILSLIKQESGFEKGIHSSVGASGYMQLMPFTASDVEPDVKREDLLEAETNIRIGSKYLKKMLTKFNGNVALALAAYNAGPTTVDRWIREGRADQGMMEFVERIPYKETRDYVGTIFRNYVYYSRKLEGRIVSSLDSFWPPAWTSKGK